MRNMFKAINKVGVIDVVLATLLLTLNIFLTLCWCFIFDFEQVNTDWFTFSFVCVVNWSLFAHWHLQFIYSFRFERDLSGNFIFNSFQIEHYNNDFRELYWGTLLVLQPLDVEWWEALFEGTFVQRVLILKIFFRTTKLFKVDKQDNLILILKVLGNGSYFYGRMT